MPTSLDLAGRLSAVVALQQEILGVASDIDKVIHRVVSRVPALTNGSGAVIEMIDGDALVYRAASGPAAEHIGKRVPFAASLSGEAIRKRDVMRCDDAETDPRADRAACRAIGIRSMIIAPLMNGTNAIGALKTYATRTGVFDDLDAYTVQLLAGMTSSALMLAQEFHNRQASEARYRMLFERNVAGVFRTTDDGRILDCNDALAETLGYSSREDLITHQVWELYSDRNDRETFLTSLRNNQTIKNLRLHLKKKDGTPMTGIINASVLAIDGEEFQLLGTLVAE